MEKNYIFFVLFLMLSQLLKCRAERVALTSDGGLENEVSVNISDVLNENPITTYGQLTVIKYNCFAERSYLFGSKMERLAYGKNSWTFPQQNVNLSLVYPLEKHDDSYVTYDSETNKIVTGFLVILHYDGKDISGFIETGGLMEESITLSFVMQGTSTVSYQFWLFGVDKASFTNNEDATEWPMIRC